MTVRKSLFALLAAQAQEFNNVCFIEFNVTGASEDALILTTADLVKYRVEGDEITLIGEAAGTPDAGNVQPGGTTADTAPVTAQPPADLGNDVPAAPVLPAPADITAAPVAPSSDAGSDTGNAQGVPASSEPAPTAEDAPAAQDAPGTASDQVTATPAGADAGGGSATDVGAAAASPGVDPAQGAAANDAGTAASSQDVADALTIEQRLTAILTNMNAIAIDGTGQFLDGHPVFAVRGQDGTEVARGTILQLEVKAAGGTE